MKCRGFVSILVVALWGISSWYFDHGAECPASEEREDQQTSDNGFLKPLVAVAGVRSEIRNPEYGDRAIGFGVSAYIAEELDKSGLFRFAEEDEAMVERIKSVQEKVWLLKEDFKKADLVRLSTEAECDILAYGRVIEMKECRKRSFVGPANVGKKIGEVRIEVSLFIRKEGCVLEAVGRGKSSKGVWGFVSEGRTEALDFDDYMIGQASREAVKKAVAGLVKQYRSARKAGIRNAGNDLRENSR